MRFKQVIVVTKIHPKDLRPATRHIHEATLKNVIRWLKNHAVKTKVVDRNHLQSTLKADLVLAIGGDGTALATSHFLKNTPLLGINSAPQTSTGFFCAAGPKNFPAYLKAILAGKKKPSLVYRLGVAINGRRLPYPALNELLFASRLQGETARYFLRVGTQVEAQKSSGLWVATAAGSTGAIFSAGGKKDSPFSKRIQYRVREPFRFPKNRYRILNGFLKPGQKLTLLSDMNAGMIFIDGAKLHTRVDKGARITVRGGLAPLKIFLEGPPL